MIDDLRGLILDDEIISNDWHFSIFDDQMIKDLISDDWMIRTPLTPPPPPQDDISMSYSCIPR